MFFHIARICDSTVTARCARSAVRRPTATETTGEAILPRNRVGTVWNGTEAVLSCTRARRPTLHSMPANEARPP